MTGSRRSTVEQCRMIRLYAEGTFYRAYEWSAWLCVRYIQDFKATKRKFKNEDARYQNPNCAVFDSKLRSFSSETAQFETRNRAV